jgi:hypothetical protein
VPPAVARSAGRPGGRWRAAIKKELAGYTGIGERRRRKRGKAAEGACSFCGKQRSSELRLIAGPGVYICAECIELCNEILAEEQRPPAPQR